MDKFLRRLLGALVFTAAALTAKTQCAPAGFQYSRSVTIANPNTALTAFQVKVVLNTQAIISAGKMQANGADIRFTDGACTSLPYWIENQTINTANTAIWVKVPAVPNGTSNTVTLHYGNTIAPSASNGALTFEMFDDFNNLNAWSQCASSVGPWGVTNTPPAGAGVGSFAYPTVNGCLVNDPSMLHPTYMFTDGTIETRFFSAAPVPANSCFRNGTAVTFRSGNSCTTSGYGFRAGYGAFAYSLSAVTDLYNGGAGTQLASFGTESSLVNNQYYRYVIKAVGTSISASVSEGLPATTLNATSTTNAAGRVGLATFGNPYVDWIFVRKPAATEPITTVGPEQANMQGPANIVNGIELWLDASNVNNTTPATNPANNTAVTTWKDISGNANNATIHPGQNAGVMNSATIGGKDAVKFNRITDGNGSVYQVAGVDIRSVAMPKTTIFTVYRQGTYNTGEQHAIWGNDNGLWDRFFYPVHSSVPGANNGMVSVGPPTNYVGITGSGVPGQTRLLTAVYDSLVTNGSVIYFNAVPVQSVTDNTSPTAAQTNLRIGWDGDNGTFNGDMAEMIVYNRKLTECEIKAVNRYLGYKYNVSFTTATISPSPAATFCAGGTTTLTASAGTSYQWLRNGTIVGGATAQTYAAGIAGSYRVIVTANGCPDTSAVTAVTEFSAILHVDSSVAVSGTGASWASPLKTVSEALTLANSVSCPVSIWVKKGTYYPMAGTAVSGSRDSSFRIMRSGIKIYGGFAGGETTLGARNITANPTILSGDIGIANDSTDNSYHVFTVTTGSGIIDTSARIDGFTITQATGGIAGTGSTTVNGLGVNRQDGGGLYFGAGATGTCSPTLANCTITDNAANFGGGLYCNAFTNATVTCRPVIAGCTFSGNRAISSGGGIFSNGNTYNIKLSVTGSRFTGNTATSGGAMYNNSSVVTLSADSLLANRATANGGAVYNATDTFTVLNSAFLNNVAATNGGGIFNSNSRGSYTNTYFGADSAATGGAVYKTGGTWTYTGCTFSGNKSVANASAISASGDVSTYTNCSFNSNSAGLSGTVYATNDTLTFTGSTVTGNTCTTTGNGSPGPGIVSDGNALLTVTGSSFTNNFAAAGIGGGISAYGYATISGSVFTGNTAGRGGAVANTGNGKLMTISQCRFNTNSSGSYGGALINMFGANIVVTQSSFTGNIANGSNGGGVIYGQNSGSILFQQDTMTANRSFTIGGVITVLDNPTTFENCILTGNRATSNGGAAYLQTAPARFTGCVFEQDTAASGGGVYTTNCPGFYSAGNFFDRNIAMNSTGGAINASNSLDTIVNCVLTGNRALVNSGGGIFYSGNTTAYNSLIANNTFYKDTAVSGGAIRLAPSTLGTLGIYNNISWQNSGGTTPFISNGTTGTVVTVSNNLDLLDPLFVNAANPVGTDDIWGTSDDGLQLTLCSPAINFGDNAFIAGFATDAKGATRIQQSTVDAGAYETAPGTPVNNSSVIIALTSGGDPCGTGAYAFTAIPVNSSSTSTFQWFVNNVAVSGATASTYNAGTLPNGTLVSVTINGNSACSATGTFRTATGTAPVVTITSAATACAPSTITTTSSIPPIAIQWNLNGSPLTIRNAEYAAAGVTVAGGNGGGTAANQLSGPLGTFVDRSSNVYVAEYLNHRVTKWAPPYTTGTVVAGGNGAGAALNQLNQPGDILVDDAANVYVADRANHRIVRWNAGATSGVVVAGGNGAGAALNQTNFPTSLGMDYAGNLYVAEFSGARVSKWAPGAAAGVVVAGTGTAGAAAGQLNNPSYLWVDKPTGNLYIADESNHRVQFWPSGAASGTTVAGGNGAGANGNQLNGPRGIYRDGIGNLYINDGNNARVQLYQPGAPAGTTLFGGNGSGAAANQFDFPLDLAVDTAGNAYVADLNNNRIQRFTPSINTSLQAITPGVYTATMVPVSGCTGTSGSVTIGALPLTMVDTASPVVCPGDSVILTASSAVLKGNALDFTGANGNYADIPHGASNSLAGQSNFTVGAWIYPRSDAHQNILYKGYGCAAWHEWQLGIGGAEADVPFGGQKWTFSYFITNGGGLNTIASSNNVALNQWSYVSVSYDGSRMRMYVNGALENEAAASGTPWASTTNLYIGQDPGCGGRVPFNGRVDEVSVWNSTLTQTGIAAQMNGIIPATAPGLLGHWRFDENNGNKVYDMGPSGQYGTMAGNSWTRQISSTAPVQNASTTPVTYVWSPAAGLNTTTGATVTATPSVNTQYTITASNGSCTNIARVAVDLLPPPTAGVTPAGPVTVCANSLQTLTADSGPGYSWQWYMNGSPISGATAMTYTPSATGSYTVRVENAAGCLTMSAPVSVTVTPNVTPSVTIAPNPTGTICSGTNVVFTASPVNGGSAPQYQWIRNGVFAGTQTPTYADATLNNGATIQVRMISDAVCRLPDTVYSNTITMSVNTTPAISSTAFTNPTTCNGSNGTITLNGLMANSAFTVNYEKNAVAQTATITANGGGSAVITGLTAGSYTNISVTQNGCVSNTVSPFTLTDPANPAAPVAGSNTPVCQGTTLSLTATGQAGASFSWTGPASFTSNMANATLANMQAVNTGTYSVTQTVAGCISPAATTVVAMSTVPPAPGAISGNTAPCAGVSQTYSIAPVATATSYSWTLPPGWTGTSTSNTITVVPSSASGSVSVAAVNVCGASTTSGSLAIGTLSIPATPGTITGAAAVCSGVTQTYSVPPVTFATSYTWSLPVGWTGTSTSTSITVTPNGNGGTISVTATGVCGTSSASTKPVTSTVIPAQPSVISGATSACSGVNQTYSVTADPNVATYSWTIPTGWTTTGSTTSSSITLTPNGTGGTITVTGTNYCGTSTARTLAVGSTIIPVQPSTITGTTAVCAGVAQTYSVTADANVATYNWTIPTGWTTLGSTTNSITVTPNAVGGTISVTGTNYCGTSLARTLAVGSTAIPVQPGTISGNSPVCSGVSQTYSIAAVPDATSYTWTLPSGWSGSSTSASITTIPTGVGGTITVLAQNYCGSSPLQSKAVSSTTIPVLPGTISGATAVCAGVDQTYSITADPNVTTYNWTIPSGWTTAGSTTSSITVTPTATGGTISVSGTNYCGTSTVQTKTLSSTATPVAPGTISGLTSICNGSTQTYTVAAVPNATSYNWTMPGGWTGSSTTNSITVVASPTSGSVTVSATNYCGTSTTQSLAVTVTSIPVQPGTISGNTAPCQGTQQVYSIAAVPAATTYTWTYPGGWTGGSNTTSINLLTSASQGAVIVTASNVCGTSPAQSLGISTIPLPAQPSPINGAPSVCSGVQQTYSVPLVSGATSYQWTLPVGWTGSSNTNTITVTTGTTSGTISVAAFGTCGYGPARTMAVTTTQTVVPTVSAAVTGGNVVCATVPVTFTQTSSNGGPAPVYTWRKNGVIVWVGSSYTAFNLANGDSVNVTLTSSAPCGLPQSVTSAAIYMTVNPAVTPGINIATTPPAVLCAGTPITLFTNITGGGSSPIYQWYKNGVLMGGQTNDSLVVIPTVGTDTFTVLLTSNAQCAIPASMISNKRWVTGIAPVTPTITISASPGTFVPAGSTVVYTANWTNGGSSPVIRWKRNGVVVPGVTGATYTGTNIQNGDTVSVELINYDQCVVPAEAKAGVRMGTPTSITGTKGNLNGLRIHPNPSSGYFTIEAEWNRSNVGERVRIEMINSLGQVVYRTEVVPDKSTWSVDIRMSEAIANGVYQLSISTPSIRENRPVVIRR